MCIEFSLLTNQINMGYNTITNTLTQFKKNENKPVKNRLIQVGTSGQIRKRVSADIKYSDVVDMDIDLSEGLYFMQVYDGYKYKTVKFSVLH